MLGMHSSRQAFDVQILHSNTAKAVDKICGQLVQIVPSFVGDVCFVLSFAKPNLVAAFRAFLTTGKCPCPLAQSFGGFFGEVGAGQRLAIGQGNQRSQPNVNANRCTWRCLRHLHFDVENDMPFAVLAREDCGGWFTWQRAMPLAFDFASDAYNADATTVTKRQSIANAKLGGVVTGRCAKPWKAGFLASLAAPEECLEGLVEPSQYLLFSRERPPFMTAANSANSLQFESLILIRTRDTALAVGVDTLLKPRIIQRAEVAQHLAKHARLKASWVKAVFVAEKYLSKHLMGAPPLRLNVAPYRRCRDGTDRGAEVGPAPQGRQFLAQGTRGVGFNFKHHLSRCPTRVRFDKKVNVVWHDFQGVNSPPPKCCRFPNQFGKSLLNRAGQYWQSVLGTPDTVIFKAENCPGILGVSRVRLTHASLYHPIVGPRRQSPRRGMVMVRCATSKCR